MRPAIARGRGPSRQHVVSGLLICCKRQLVSATATTSLISLWTFAVRHAIRICLEDTFGDRNEANITIVTASTTIDIAFDT